MTVFGDVREDAGWWAARATPVELLEYLSVAMRALGDRALHVSQRKQLFRNLWQSFGDTDRLAFIKAVTKGKINGT